MDRIDLAPGKTTPEFVEKVLSVLGNNPHGEPLFRLVWSERKRIYFAGEIVPEYAYLSAPCWILETWTPPEKDAGSEIMWGPEQEFLMGPYPRKGTYNFGQGYPSDWYPTEESVKGIAKGIEASRDIALKLRKEAIVANLEAQAKVDRQKVADEIVELQDSASLGKIQQSASGPKNTFRTPEDYGRDVERGLAKVVRVPTLPKRGGRIIQGDA
jgi:hypothetical protein